jgi:transcription elongation factor Elf1
VSANLTGSIANRFIETFLNLRYYDKLQRGRLINKKHIKRMAERTLFERLNLKRNYMINARCRNCGAFFELSIPKGITVDSFVNSDGAKCDNCGCSTIEAFKQDKKKPKMILTD